MKRVFAVAAAFGLACCTPFAAEDPYLRTHEPSAAVGESCGVSARALCAYADDCSPQYVAYYFGSIEQCRKDVARVCLSRYSGPGAASSPVACATLTVEKVRCDVFVSPLAQFLRPIGEGLLASCPVTPGAFPDGAPCLRDGDCASGSCSEGGTLPKRDLGPAQCRRCRTEERRVIADDAPIALDGAACSAITDCALGLGFTCGNDGRCASFSVVGAGEVCVEHGNPEPGDRLCAARTSCTEGICLPTQESSDDLDEGLRPASVCEP